MTPALLALADGRVFRGEGCGAAGEAQGEVVFNTSMTGYQEILTDPSYRGQIVCMTYPLIGNYGINAEDVESRRPWVNGFIVKEACQFPSNWRGRMPLHDYMREHGIVGIQSIDTRALTRHLRDHGAQGGIISTLEPDPERLVERARALPGLVGRDLVSEVTVEQPHGWTEGRWELARGYLPPPAARLNVIAYDSGIKQNILRQLTSLGCAVDVVPARTPAAAVLERKPDGVFLANGPGDPEGVPYLIESVRALIGKAPIFGICLGNQILALAVGGATYKLKFGHHGANHPVRDLSSGVRPRGDPCQPQRRHLRGDAPPGAADLLGPVPPRGLPRPARRALPLPPFHRDDGRDSRTGRHRSLRGRRTPSRSASRSA